MKEIKNGDVYDIGQTINGVSTFLWFNDSIFYYSERMGHRDLEYEYDRNELTHLVEQDYDEQTTYLGNIFQNSKCINPINTIIEDDKELLTERVQLAVEELKNRLR